VAAGFSSGADCYAIEHPRFISKIGTEKPAKVPRQFVRLRPDTKQIGCALPREVKPSLNCL